MALDDEKFSQLLVALGLNTEDRKMLIRIEEKLSNHLDNYRREQVEVNVKVDRADQKAKAAHDRVDRIIGIGGWTVFLTVGGLVMSVLFNLWNINEKRFERLQQPSAYAATRAQ